jgi:hypothetical protein
MVEVKLAAPLIEVARTHPDRKTRLLALETLVHLPLEPAAARLAEPVAAGLPEMPGAVQLLGTLRGGRGRVTAPAPPRPKPPAGYKRLEVRLLDRPFQGARVNASDGELRLLGAMPPRSAGKILVAGLRQLSAGRVRDPQRVGGAVIELAAALPEPLMLQLDEILDIEEITTRLPREPLAWALSRAGAEALAAQLGARIKRASEAETQKLLPWMRDIAVNLGVPAPRHSAEARMVRADGGRTPMLSMARAAAGAGAGAHARSSRSGEALADVRLFPHVSCEAHPLAGAQLDIAVSLSGSQQEGVTGVAYLPPGFHRLRVHLMVADVSQWGECSAGEGKEEPALFSVRLPPIAGERALLPVRANFYLNGRWCGEGERNLDVRASGKVLPLAEIPAPAAPAWRDGLVIEPGAQPPDLIVRIQRKASVGEYLWYCLSPHFNLPQPSAADSAMALGQDAETYVRNLFKPHAGKKLSEVNIADIEGAGELIYQATPKSFKDAYWAVWRAAQEGHFAFDSIQFVTDEPYIPWELMRVSDAARAPGVKAEILAIRHSVGRWLSIESARLSQNIRAWNVAVAASDYAAAQRVPRPRQLPWAAKEKALLVADYSAREVPLVSGELKKFLERGGAQVLHFACHGTMLVSNPMGSALIMEDPDDLKATMVNRQEVREGIGAGRPLIFLNACEVGGAASALSLVAGFPNAFLYAGAAAVVSPLWVVADDTALEIAREFYQAVLVAPPQTTLGSVMRTIRKRWAEKGNLTYLAYVLYGDPLARIVYQREAGAA